jgi:hypothetical protein
VSDDEKSPIEQAVGRALDLFFYAPIGLALGADDVIEQLVARGKQQVAAARMFGQFAVQQGQTEATKAVGRMQEQLTRSRSPQRPAAATSPPAATAPKHEAARTAPASSGPGAAALAIPDYDSLSASQVLPRLAGLSGDELEAVRDYESAHRGRKTILGRVAQLQTL